MSDAAIDVLVIGAGIVGLSCAMRLQMDGRKVELLDPNEPASGASSGNAGYLAEGHIHPPAASVSLARLPKMLLDPTGPLVLRPGYLPRMIPWGMRALAGLRSGPLARTMDALAALNRRAIDSYEPYLERSGSRALFDRRGSLTVYRTAAALEVAARRIPVIRAHGLGMERLGTGELRELEPAVASDVAGAIYYPGSGRCLNPLRLGQRFAHTLATGGAVFHRAAARQLVPRSDGGWSVVTDGASTLTAKAVVVSTGGRGDGLLEPLGYEVPLAAERGYHLMLPAARVEISRPVSSGECMFAMTQMEHGLRLAGTAEYAHIDAPADLRRADMLLGLAQRYLPGLSGEGATRWMGVRPSLPDGLPAIGQGHRHRNLYYCFGHQHLGLTLAAVSATLLGAVIAQGSPAVDVTPYSLARFERAA